MYSYNNNILLLMFNSIRNGNLHGYDFLRYVTGQILETIRLLRNYQKWQFLATRSYQF